MSVFQKDKGEKEHLVLLIHGIRTHAWWQGEVKALIEENTNAHVIPLKYGKFDLLRFWCPLNICRRGPIDRLHKELRSAIKLHNGGRITIIAHSYGTYALSHILLKHDDIQLHRIILCGSIIPTDFPWTRVAPQLTANQMRKSVINDCGTRDVWPVLAAATTWGYGSSGTHGFGSVQISDRVHVMPHSGYFNKAFVRKYWLPFIKNGDIIPSDAERRGESTKWWFSLLELPYKWAMVILLFFVTFSSLFSSYGVVISLEKTCKLLGQSGFLNCAVTTQDLGSNGDTPSNTSAEASQTPNTGQAIQNIIINGDGNSPKQTFISPIQTENQFSSEYEIDENGNVILRERIE